MSTPDLVIRGGTIIDGTGAPGFEADVAIAGGRIAAIGKVEARGAEEIDARGQIVTPGFVDIHTHYDGQAVWDSHLQPSAWHGVTTAVMGNCGVGFAPVKPGDRDRLIELMEGVEDIPGPALHEGLQWSWESFPQYLDALERKPRDIDICAQLPHAALRVFVMGKRASHLEHATEAEIAEMAAIAEDAMCAGAIGFSTSRTISHKTLAGDPTPTLRAQEAELVGIALGMKRAGAGQLEMVSDFSLGVENEFGMFRRMVQASGRPMVFSLSQNHSTPDSYKTLMRLSREAQADGICIRPVFPPRPIGILFGLLGSQNPFSGTPTFKSLLALSFEDRVAAMRDPAVKARILSEDRFAGSNFPLINRLSFARMFPFGDPPDYEPPQSQSVEAIAAREGRTAEDVAYDMLVGDGGRNFLFTPLTNYAHYNLEPCREALEDRNVLTGLSDGGAHVGFISDGSFPTYLLQHWGRDRSSGRFPIEELVRKQTSDTAHAVGLLDRGVIAPGKKADLNVIDFDKLALQRPEMKFDLPAGGRRLLQQATGYTATIKSGQITYRHGQATGALPGTLVRGAQA
jgi:N-acyl-D-aspartate/D-glutamate deacylase